MTMTMTANVNMNTPSVLKPVLPTLGGAPLGSKPRPQSQVHTVAPAGLRTGPSRNATHSPAHGAARGAARGATRCKATYDLGVELTDQVTDVARSLGCSQSDVVAHFIAAGLALFAEGQLDLKRVRVPHTCTLRFAYKLPAPRLKRMPTVVTLVDQTTKESAQ